MSDENFETIAAVFAITEEKWNSQNFPYQQVHSFWSDHHLAHKALSVLTRLQNPKIDLRHLGVLESGRVIWKQVKVVFEDGVWVSGEHDPRAVDPQYREYLRLRQIYEED